MALYYARYPEAAASFEHHGLGKTAALEGEMVENCLYCLMHCIDRRGEIDILLETSVPHHHFTLDVRSEEHTSELQSLMPISYAVFCLTTKQSSYNTEQHQNI